MTDIEIINALKRCGQKNNKCWYCESVELRTLLLSTLELVNHQKKEIERLKGVETIYNKILAEQTKLLSFDDFKKDIINKFVFSLLQVQVQGHITLADINRIRKEILFDK